METLSGLSASSMAASSFSYGRRNIALFVFFLLWALASCRGASVDKTRDTRRNKHELERFYHYDSRREHLIETDVNKRRNLRPNKHDAREKAVLKTLNKINAN